MITITGSQTNSLAKTVREGNSTHKNTTVNSSAKSAQIRNKKEVLCPIFAEEYTAHLDRLLGSFWQEIA